MKKYRLKDSVRMVLIVILLLLAAGFIVYIDYTVTTDTYEHCKRQTSGAYYCEDLR